jgi:hypothetical protein
MKENPMRIVLGMATFCLVVVGLCSPAPAQMSAARAAAIHECSVKAAAYSQTAWQSTQIIIYDKCMAEHGQIP